ncbi:MAG: hypothetical protein PGN13_16315 [Patulibacter minatonensis]
MTALALTFADAERVRRRLGRPVDVEQATALLEQAADLVLEAAGRSPEWAAERIAAGTVPLAFRTTSIEAVVRVLLNPQGVRSQGRTIGKVSRQESFADASAGLVLTEREEARCRRAVNTGGPAMRLGSTVLEEIGPALGAGSSALANLNGESP